ncbi:hypothetical protein RG47T_4324 [Mucilaginibacter polytrichastri]|uniref:Uncharacterized protein n=1 Tax=Mucilaginibacter polytrichastri TaxID=1302689 RepID=A0A1Q6A4B9_9SPHI|nr:hypothetical protein RG47T_4324 [Mucilaginibacter polytrichastri]
MYNFVNSLCIKFYHHIVSKLFEDASCTIQGAFAIKRKCYADTFTLVQ